jgi:RND family efflux transporter MFP subunit
MSPDRPIPPNKASEPVKYSVPAPADHTDHSSHAGEHHETAPDQKPIRRGTALTVVIVLLLVMVALGIFGILPRQRAMAKLKEDTQVLAAPSVIALSPALGAPVQELILPGNVTSYTDSPIYARTNGYLTKWYYDIGARVKKGALLAEISTPEVDQQLAQAQADLATAQATANNSRIQADRYKGLVASNAVSQQDTDTFVNQAASQQAQVKSAEANVQRLQELRSFEKVYAPFDGLVTARNIDTGQLVDSGAGKELFHLQAVQTLRVYTNLPDIFSNSVRVGEIIDMTFADRPGQVFHGKLVRTADAVDPASRTLLVEVDVDNRDGKLLAGSLAQVHFKGTQMASVFVLPVSALIFRADGLRVGTVRGDTAHLVPVIIGEDDGRTVQIVTGLTKDDKVIQDPPDSLIEGEKVHVLTPDEVRTAQGGK